MKGINTYIHISVSKKLQRQPKELTLCILHSKHYTSSSQSVKKTILRNLYWRDVFNKQIYDMKQK